MTAHRFSVDTDRCVCGGEVVYFEDQRPPGEGCDVQGQPWVTGEHARFHELSGLPVPSAACLSCPL
jgi:hypothetical protein